ncbi:O-antigen ligase family protein [Oceanithermus desulfurans]|uniref:O-antigen ligase n=1 Tax=Oceanithermus desulfurans TaxID=227924 RepID=A0ABR6P372_9DEIN|nr:hypothetical protein [Oceanithermus desulfurans]MBB6030464.1 O-antigen ligase [Oceanithermus desulfurans]
MQLAIPFYGLLRPVLVMFIFLNISFDEPFIWRMIKYYIWTSIPIAILSIGQTLGSSVALQITLLGYTSPSRAPVFKLLEEHGSILRSTGVFESPVFNAVYFLSILTIVVFALVSKSAAFGSRRLLYIVLGLAALAGITTLSTTFLLGTILILAMLVFFLGHKYPMRFLYLAIGGAFMTGFVVLISWPFLARQATFTGSFRYQVDKIVTGAIFSTRYDLERGIFRETYEAIQQSPVLGWGLTQSADVFLGDSIYIIMLYRGGIIGLSAFLLLIYRILKYAWKNRNQRGIYGIMSWVVLMWTLLLLATGFGSPSFFILRLQEWYWAVVGATMGLYLQQYRNSSRCEHNNSQNTT